MGTTKKRFAVYLRPESKRVIDDLLAQGTKSIGKVAQGLISRHSHLKESSPITLLRARQHLEAAGILPLRSNTVGREKMTDKKYCYLNQMSQIYSEQFAQEHCGGNASHAINQIIIEIGAVDVLLKRDWEQQKNANT